MKPSAEIAAQFGRNLARCRKKAGISQEELGYRAQIHRTEVSLLERGERTPRADTIVKLAGGISVPVAELLDGPQLDAEPHRSRGRRLRDRRGARGAVTFKARFAQNLARARKQAGLTQEEVAARASLGRDTVWKHEAEVHVPILDVLVRLAGAVSVQPAELLDGIILQAQLHRPGGGTLRGHEVRLLRAVRGASL